MFRKNAPKQMSLIAIYCHITFIVCSLSLNVSGYVFFEAAPEMIQYCVSLRDHFLLSAGHKQILHLTASIHD